LVTDRSIEFNEHFYITQSTIVLTTYIISLYA